MSSTDFLGTCDQVMAGSQLAVCNAGFIRRSGNDLQPNEKRRLINEQIAKAKYCLLSSINSAHVESIDRPCPDTYRWLCAEAFGNPATTRTTVSRRAVGGECPRRTAPSDCRGPPRRLSGRLRDRDLR